MDEDLQKFIERQFGKSQAAKINLKRYATDPEYRKRKIEYAKKRNANFPERKREIDKNWNAKNGNRAAVQKRYRERQKEKKSAISSE